MTIKITGLELKKDKINSTYRTGSLISQDISKLDGKLLIKLSEGIAEGNGELQIANISEKLYDKLHGVLNEIEDELNGVEKKGSVKGGSIGYDSYSKEESTTSRNEFEELSEAIDKATEVFNVFLNIGESTSKTAKEISEELVNSFKLKNSSKF